MAYPADDFKLVKELHEQDESFCEISRRTGIARSEVRRILGFDTSQRPPRKNGNLSVRERQALLNWRAACNGDMDPTNPRTNSRLYSISQYRC